MAHPDSPTPDQTPQPTFSENPCVAGEEKYNTLFTTLTQGIVYQNADGKIINANPAAERILGVSLDQMQGFSSMDPRWKAIREDGSDFPGSEHPLPVALRTGKPVNNLIHGIFHPQKNDFVWIKANAIPLFRKGESKPYQAYATIEDVTAQHTAESNYRMLFDKMLNGFALHEIICNDSGVPVDYRFITVNPAFEQMTGLKADDIIGQRVLDIMPGTEEHWIKMYGSVALSGKPVYFENYSAELDKHFEVTAFCPTPGQFACLFADITQRKQAEESLRFAYLKLDAFWNVATVENASIKTLCDHVLVSITHMTASPFGFFGFINSDESIMTVHSWSGEAMKGCSIVDKPSTFLISDAGIWGEAVRARKSLIINDYTASHPAKKGLPEGHVPLTRLMVVPVFSSGKIVAVAAVANRTAAYTESDAKHFAAFSEAIQAIIDRKQAEERLVESTAMLEQALSAANAGTWDWHIVANKFTWSKEFLHIFGIDPALPPDFNQWASVVHPDDLQKTTDIIQESIQNRTELLHDYRIVDPDGSLRWIRSIGKTLYENDIPVRVSGLCMDITERKQAEVERERLERALNQTQKLDSLGLLAGGIAHDFNNLMGGIFGYIDLAQESSTDATVARYLSKAMNTIDRARALTLQLLTFAKGGDPVRETGKLFPFVQETALFALSGANVSCTFDIPPNLWLCNFDKHQIGQVIDNLVINAQQAMPVGGTIRVSAGNITLAEHEHPLLPKGNYITLAVKDTGIGIPEDLITKIFDPFFTTKQKGHGLGLASCYSIIKKHGGCIDVTSVQGKGSTFLIYLPASTKAASLAAPVAASTHRGSGTILVMDDEDVIRDTIGEMLSALGYTVVCTEDGQAAVDMFTTATCNGRVFAAIILDLTVPGAMGGKDAAAAIRKLDTRVPVFVASGYSEDPVMKNPAHFNITDSIRKPFTKSELSEMLNRHLRFK